MTPPRATTPRRIVSLVPSWTETVFALGVGERLIACTRYCVEPMAQLASVLRIGGTKNPKVEAIADLEPELVLVNAEENRAEHIDWLRRRFEVFEATPRSVPEAGDFVRRLGRRLEASAEAEAIVLAIEAQCARGEAEALTKGTVRVFYSIWRKPWMSINRDTYIHDVLRRAGAINVAAERGERYPELDARELAALGAELVLLPDEPFAFTAAHGEELADQGLFGGRCAIRTVSGKDYCWHGARTAPGLGRAIDQLAPYRRRR